MKINNRYIPDPWKYKNDLEQHHYELGYTHAMRAMHPEPSDKNFREYYMVGFEEARRDKLGDNCD